MGWRRFEISRDITVPAQRAFDFVADYRNVPRVLEGVTRWEPISSRSSGRGARFEVEMRTLGVPLGNVLVLDAWEPPRRIGWRSESGLIAQRGGWTFEPGAGQTTVTLRIEYNPPGAALGSLLASRADGLVRNRLRRALEEMAGLLESGLE